MNTSSIDYVFQGTDLDYDPHPQRLQECADELARGVENLLNVDIPTNVLELVTSVIVSVSKLKQQADYTVGHLIGHLEGEIKDKESLDTLLDTLRPKLRIGGASCADYDDDDK